MDFFKGMFGFITGNYNEIDKPIFTKPYIDKSYDLLELARRLDKAPEESKQGIRDEMEAMASKIKTHQRVNDLLTNSNMPLLILYDLHLLCDAGETNIDYVVLTNRFIAAISCPTQENEEETKESYAATAPDEEELAKYNEHSAYILTEILNTEKLVNKKNLQMIRPLTVSSIYAKTPGNMEVPAKGTSANKSKIVPPLFSQTYPSIHRNIFVKPEGFLAQIKLFFQEGDEFCWLTNKELFAISEVLLDYDKKSGQSGES